MLTFWDYFWQVLGFAFVGVILIIFIGWIVWVTDCIDDIRKDIHNLYDNDTILRDKIKKKKEKKNG